MRYPAAEKLEIIRLVEHAPLPVRDTLAKLGISRASFYRWYDRYRHGGPDTLADRAPRAQRVWNRIPQAVRDSVIQLALDAPALSPRELAARFTDTRSYFISEASVYRLLKTQGLIASPAVIVIKAAGSFKEDQRAQPAVADRFHLPEGDRLGLVLSVERARRLLALHRGLEAVHHHAGRGCLKLELPRFDGHRRCFCARCPFYGQDPSPLCAGVSAPNGRAGACRA